MYIFLNGKAIPSEEALISIYDHGYLYGVGLFETFRTYSGHPFLLVEHLRRLEEGCKQIGIKWRADPELLQERIKELLILNQLEDGYFRYNLSAGPHPIGLIQGLYTEITEALFVKPLPNPPRTKQLHTVQTPRNTPEGKERLKSHHYLNNIIAKRETPAQAEGVMLTKEGKVAEGIVSNLFFVRNQVLYTPSLSTGILNGITRQVVLSLAQQLGMKTEQGEYELSFAQRSDEVFVTNSIQEVVPVHQWDHQTYMEKPGPITEALIQRYDQVKGSWLTYQSKLGE